MQLSRYQRDLADILQMHKLFASVIIWFSRRFLGAIGSVSQASARSGRLGNDSWRENNTRVALKPLKLNLTAL